ncbi:MAG: hypothetical protein HY280_00105 [Nitrospinae bacterium]|nr:hypothetical protein [Nitrospinota bacterium]
MADNRKKKRAPLGVLEFSLVSVVAFAAGLFLVSLSCATNNNYAPPPSRSLPTFADMYNWPKYTPPEAAKPASVPLTVITVNPDHNQTLLKFGTAVTLAMSKVFASFSSSMGQDFEAVMVAKGITAKGPFESYDEITYTDKETSDLVMQVVIIFDINDLSPMEGGLNELRTDVFEGGVHARVRNGKMSIGAKVFYYMYEPLSKEKMWVKKLDLGTEEYTYEMAYKDKQEAYQEFVSDGCGGGHYYTSYKYVGTTEVLYDTKPYMLATKLKNEYAKIMGAGWTYFDVEEMKNMKTRSLEIRQKKRY